MLISSGFYCNTWAKIKLGPGVHFVLARIRHCLSAAKSLASVIRTLLTIQCYLGKKHNTRLTKSEDALKKEDEPKIYIDRSITS